MAVSPKDCQPLINGMANKNNCSSSEGLRIPEDRSVRSIVPAPAETSLGAGLPAGLATSPAGASAIAAFKNKKREPIIRLPRVNLQSSTQRERSRSPVPRKRVQLAVKDQVGRARALMHRPAPSSIKNKYLVKCA